MKKLYFVALLSLLFLPFFAHASIDTNLYYGISNKPEVTELQEYLIDKGFLTGSATGNFYSLTLKAVKSYQESVGINKTGYVGVLTRKSINDELAIGLSDSNAQSVAETGSVPSNSLIPQESPQPVFSNSVISPQLTIKINQPELLVKTNVITPATDVVVFKDTISVLNGTANLNAIYFNMIGNIDREKFSNLKLNIDGEENPVGYSLSSYNLNQKMTTGDHTIVLTSDVASTIQRNAQFQITKVVFNDGDIQATFPIKSTRMNYCDPNTSINSGNCSFN